MDKSKKMPMQSYCTVFLQCFYDFVFGPDGNILSWLKNMKHSTKALTKIDFVNLYLWLLTQSSSVSGSS